MSSLEQLVEQVLTDWIDAGRSFTALDVSNEVKKTMPQKRHREVRDEVRNRFVDLIETQGYTRSPITVSLDDGSSATALLYHPLSDSWDLDTKYDQSKRGQTSAQPVAIAQAAVQAAQNPPAHWGGALPPVPSTKAAVPYNPVPNTASTAVPLPTAAPLVITPMPTARQQWNQMFQTQPSLFPKR